MAVGTIRRGKGMSERIEPALSGDMLLEDIRDTLLYTASGGSFEEWIKEPEAKAQSVLKKAGHDPDQLARDPKRLAPHRTKLIKLIDQVEGMPEGADKSRLHAEITKLADRCYRQSPNQIFNIVEDDTEEYYAAHLLRYIRLTRSAIKKHRANEAARYALQIGHLVCEHDMKVEHENVWRTGDRQQVYLKGVREGANRKRHDQAEVKHARWREEAARVRRNHPRLSDQRVAEIVKQKLKLDAAVRTIRHALKVGRAG